MCRDVGHKVFGLFVILDPPGNSDFPFFGYAYHLSLFAILYAYIQGDMLLPRQSTLAAWIAAGSSHRNQRAAQESF
jgi:uncharacterized RDD family membrane protein YckC